MNLQPVSVADAVAEELRRRLLSGYYRGGTQLRDTDLTAEFGAARPTIRAAVQMLVAEGLLERGRGKSAEVKSFTAEDAIDLYRLRRPIEAAAVDEAIKRKADLRGVQSAMDAFLALREETPWSVVVDHDVAFHRAVFAAAGSPHLLATFDQVSAEHRLLIALLRPAYDGVSALAREHHALLIALQNGDPAVARAAWSSHFDTSEQFFVKLIKERIR